MNPSDSSLSQWLATLAALHLNVSVCTSLATFKTFKTTHAFTSLVEHWRVAYSCAALSVNPCPVSIILCLYSSTPPSVSPSLGHPLSYQACITLFCWGHKYFMLYKTAACHYHLYKSYGDIVRRHAKQVRLATWSLEKWLWKKSHLKKWHWKKALSRSRQIWTKQDW